MTARRAKDSGRASLPQRNVLVVDVGGTNVKILVTAAQGAVRSDYDRRTNGGGGLSARRQLVL